MVYGGNFDLKEKYMEPTLLELSGWASVIKEEIFGPILSVLELKSLEDIAGVIKKQPKPLALYLFTKDTKEIDYILKEISFGGGCINDTMLHLASEELPFGGVGESGLGRYHGKYSFETFSHQKSYYHRKLQAGF